MRITTPMYEKGRSFVMAAGLVKAYEGHKFVYLHLLCQGFENIGKALLLATDYEKYGPMLKDVYRHDLLKLLRELQTVYGENFLSEDALTEVRSLSYFYEKHQLRYGDKLDFNTSHFGLQADSLHGGLVKLLTTFNPQFEPSNS
jgi:hypothetical protein